MVTLLTEWYPSVLGMHGLWRWAVVLFGAGAVLVGIWGLVAGTAFPGPGRHACRLYVTALDLQLLLGVVLLLASPLVQVAWADFGAAMRQREVRFFAVEHSVIMLVAVALAHVGAARARRAPTAARGYARITLWMGLSLAAILLGTPWWRPFWRVIGGS